MLGKKRRRDQNVFPAKRRQRFLVEEINYDPQARQEYLTGFHKRKVQRQKQAQETAALKEKEERRRQRAEVRAERQTYIDRHIAAMSGAGHDVPGLGALGDVMQSAESSDGEPAPEETTLDREVEYEDEERTATVTVQAVEVTREGLQPHENHANSAESPAGKGQDKAGPSAQAQRRRGSDGLNKVKRKKKKFRYESKTENKLNRAKERASGKAKAKPRK